MIPFLPTHFLERQSPIRLGRAKSGNGALASISINTGKKNKTENQRLRNSANVAAVKEASFLPTVNTAGGGTHRSHKPEFPAATSCGTQSAFYDVQAPIQALRRPAHAQMTSHMPRGESRKKK